MVVAVGALGAERTGVSLFALLRSCCGDVGRSQRISPWARRFAEGARVDLRGLEREAEVAGLDPERPQLIPHRVAIGTVGANPTLPFRWGEAGRQISWVRTKRIEVR